MTRGYTRSRGWTAIGNFSVEVDGSSVRSWDAMLPHFADASYDQTGALGMCQWGRRRLSHIVLRRGQEPVAAAQVVLLQVPLLRRGVAYVKFGPLWRPTDSPPDPAVLGAILGALRAEYSVRRRLKLVVLPPPPSGDADPLSVAFQDEGFEQPRPLLDPHRFLVNLRLNDEEQLASLHHKWRYNLRKSWSRGVLIDRCRGREGLSRYLRLHEAMVARKGLIDPSWIDLLHGVLEALPERLRPSFVFARHEGRDVAAAVVGSVGDTGTYLFGASEDRALPLNAGFALQWAVAEQCRAQGLRWYDLGGQAGSPGPRPLHCRRVVWPFFVSLLFFFGT